MSESPYLYQPRTGVLSGDAFETQTETFFSDVDERLSSLNTSLSDAVDTLTARIDSLAEQMQGALATLALHEQRLDALESAVQQLQADVLAIQPHLTPQGLIAVSNGAAPTGWQTCDGSAGTPDLSGYAELPLRFVRKTS